MKLRMLWLTAIVWSSANTTSHAQSNNIAFFEAKIRPMLAKYCYSCHSETANKKKGGLAVDTQAALLKGGESGPAIVPKSAEKSLLFQAITYHNKEMQMPPDGKLSDMVIADVRKWIEMGAPDPRGRTGTIPIQKSIDLVKGRQYWAYQPPMKQTLPKVNNGAWPRTDIDYFTLAKMEENHLKPVGDAANVTLVRRLYFTIIGLPPLQEDLATWVSKLDSTASLPAKQKVLGELVDSLLALPHYGEHWGRHWLDVARYGDSTGGDDNNVHPHAWRYRDYVIDAFNADTPYDRFIVEQLAGDLLPAADKAEFARNVIATGFLAIGVKLVGEEEGRKFFADMVDEQIDVTTKVFLATTVACARCHDHKLDPIPQADYYALAGIFRSTTTHFGLLHSQARQTTPLIDLSGMGLPVLGKTISQDELQKLKKARDDAATLVDDIYRRRRAGEQINQSVWLRSRTNRDRTDFAYQAYDSKGNPKVLVMGIQDQELPVDTWINPRGEVDQRGAKVRRGVVQVLAKSGAHYLPSTNSSGRLELAKWIASPNNPITARVMVNRIWHHVFGHGLVRSTDDFGVSGLPPTHPELLDYLALRFIENKWSVKAMIREMVLSHTWQLAASDLKENSAIDPDNQYYCRMSRKRLTAESIRDAMLVVSGNLKRERPLGNFLSGVGEGTIGRSVMEPEIRKIDPDYRSVYLPRVRNVLPEMLELFDAPDASLVAGVRDTTTSPLQGLYLMNSPFVSRQVEATAARILKKSTADTDLVKAIHLHVYGIPPTDKQRDIANQFFDQIKKQLAPTQAKSYEIEKIVVQTYCHALICSAEFRILD
ncbi:MAG: PSD1 and planctomycete cytochrome C domain-containing protein [Zavarzinella sp.]